MRNPVENQQSLELGSEHPCPRCETTGVVDFLDLVRGHAQLHCPSCPTGWAVSIEAPMGHLT